MPVLCPQVSDERRFSGVNGRPCGVSATLQSPRILRWGHRQAVLPVLRRASGSLNQPERVGLALSIKSPMGHPCGN